MKESITTCSFATSFFFSSRLSDCEHEAFLCSKSKAHMHIITGKWMCECSHMGAIKYARHISTAAYVCAALVSLWSFLICYCCSMHVHAMLSSQAGVDTCLPERTVEVAPQFEQSHHRMLTLLSRSAYSKSSMVFWRTERGSLKKNGRVMCVRSLPRDSLRMDHMMDHMLLLSSFCCGIGRESRRAGGNSISLQESNQTFLSRSVLSCYQV